MFAFGGTDYLAKHTNYVQKDVNLTSIQVCYDKCAICKGPEK